MIKELIFQNLKWFNVDTSKDSTTISGRKYFATPQKVVIPAGTNITASNVSAGLNKTLDQDATMNVIAANDFSYFVSGDLHFDGSVDGFFEQSFTKDKPVRINKSLVKNVIWGG